MAGDRHLGHLERHGARLLNLQHGRCTDLHGDRFCSHLYRLGRGYIRDRHYLIFTRAASAATSNGRPGDHPGGSCSLGGTHGFLGIDNLGSSFDRRSTNGGGFDVGNANFDNTITAASANTASPVITWTNYAFQAADVGSLLFIKSGTNWIPGWYPIASVLAGVATLNAAIGAVQLYGGATLLNTVAGCASTASPTAGVGSIDYTQASTSTGVWSASAGIAVTAISNSGTGGTATIATGMTIAGTAYAIGATVIPPNIVGNIISINSGSGFTVQRVQVSSVVAGLATVDKTLGGTGLTGGVGTLGGTLDGIGTLSGAMVASNKAFITGSFTVTTATTFAQSAAVSNTVMPNMLAGYAMYRGDNGKATITLSTATNITVLAFSNVGWIIQNLVVDCANLTGTIGIILSSAGTVIRQCLVKRFGSKGIVSPSMPSLILQCEICCGTGGSRAIDGSACYYNYVHDNQCVGIGVNNPGVCVGNLVVNNTGASSDGITTMSDNSIMFNTVYGNGRHAINENQSSGPRTMQMFASNLLVANGGYGIVAGTGIGWPSVIQMDGNAYYGNAGTRYFMNDVGSINPINGVAPYVPTFST